MNQQAAEDMLRVHVVSRSRTSRVQEVGVPVCIIVHAAVFSMIMLQTSSASAGAVNDGEISWNETGVAKTDMSAGHRPAGGFVHPFTSFASFAHNHDVRH